LNAENFQSFIKFSKIKIDFQTISLRCPNLALEKNERTGKSPLIDCRQFVFCDGRCTRAANRQTAEHRNQAPSNERGVRHAHAREF
jgi:hypothetical protein